MKESLFHPSPNFCLFLYLCVQKLIQAASQHFQMLQQTGALPSSQQNRNAGPYTLATMSVASLPQPLPTQPTQSVATSYPHPYQYPPPYYGHPPAFSQPPGHDIVQHPHHPPVTYMYNPSYPSQHVAMLQPPQHHVTMLQPGHADHPRPPQYMYNPVYPPQHQVTMLPSVHGEHSQYYQVVHYGPPAQTDNSSGSE